MPIRGKIEDWMVDFFKRVVRRNYTEWLQYPCEATLSILLIRLYEVGIALYGYNSSDESNNHRASHNEFRNHVGMENSTALVQIRNVLVHNIEYVRLFNLYLYLKVLPLPEEFLDSLYTYCTDSTANFYESIVSYLASDVEKDRISILYNRLCAVDFDYLDLQNYVCKSLPTLIQDSATLKQMLPIVESYVELQEREVK